MNRNITWIEDVSAVEGGEKVATKVPCVNDIEEQIQGNV